MRIDIRIVGFVSLGSAAMVGACNGQDDTTAGRTGAIQCDGGCTTVATATGVGNPCIDDNETMPNFSGYAATEINVEDRTPQCATGMCLTYFFQGRTGCPYGVGCTTPNGDPVTVSVKPQLVARSPSDTTYCSCRCDGPRHGALLRVSPGLRMREPDSRFRLRGRGATRRFVLRESRNPSFGSNDPAQWPSV